jgi:hypothetical protein
LECDINLKDLWSLISENEVRSVDSRPYHEDAGNMLWNQLSASVEEKVCNVRFI